MQKTPPGFGGVKYGIYLLKKYVEVPHGPYLGDQEGSLVRSRDTPRCQRGQKDETRAKPKR